jgi:hypothetical protein
MARVNTAVLALSIIATLAHAAERLSPEEAANHIGEQAQVCGVVASAKFATRTRGRPTFLNLGRPYPEHVFTALIWGSERPAFPYPPESLLGEEICVHGSITAFRGKPEIVVTRPSQITRAADR